MRTMLLAGVAVAALMSQAPAYAQPVIRDVPAARPEARPDIAPPPARPEAPASRAERVQERAQDKAERAQEKAQDKAERAQEKAEDKAERINEGAPNSPNARERRAQEDRRAPAGDSAPSRSANPAAERKTTPDTKASETNSTDSRPDSRADNPSARPAAPSAASPATAPASQERSRAAQPALQPNSADRPGSGTARNPENAPSSNGSRASDTSRSTDNPASPGTARSTSESQPNTDARSPNNTRAQDDAASPRNGARSTDAVTNPPANARTADPSTANPTTAAGAPSSSADAPQQRRIVESVQQSIQRNEVRPVRDLGVSVTLGATLPTRVELNPLPRDIVELRPNYRDYRYVVSEGEIVIVDPRTRQVVEVVERRGGGDRFTRVNERRFFDVVERREVRRWSRPTVTVTEGVILPADAPFYDVPTEIVEEHPDWRGYKYVATEDEVAVVEPRTRRVVQVIDRQGAAMGSSTRGSVETTASLGDEDRRAINRILVRSVTPGALSTVRDLRGATLSEDMELKPLPREVTDRNPDLRGPRYVLIGDDALIVAPNSRRVVDVVE